MQDYRPIHPVDYRPIHRADYQPIHPVEYWLIRPGEYGPGYPADQSLAKGYGQNETRVAQGLNVLQRCTERCTERCTLGELHNWSEGVLYGLHSKLIENQYEIEGITAHAGEGQLRRLGNIQSSKRRILIGLKRVFGRWCLMNEWPGKQC